MGNKTRILILGGGDLNPADIVNPFAGCSSGCGMSKPPCSRLIWPRNGCTALTTNASSRSSWTMTTSCSALGSETNFFGMQSAAENAVTLKTLGDAALLRARVLEILEAASLEPDAAVRERMLTFVVAGGGFAGVVTVGALGGRLRRRAGP